MQKTDRKKKKNFAQNILEIFFFFFFFVVFCPFLENFKINLIVIVLLRALYDIVKEIIFTAFPLNAKLLQFVFRWQTKMNLIFFFFSSTNECTQFFLLKNKYYRLNDFSETFIVKLHQKKKNRKVN